jgi:hypothetical protein
MEANEEIELQLWDYIDGTCNTADSQRISMLIKHDELWKQKYAALTALQATIADTLQLEQPSMRFSKNVMETVAAAHIAPATKKYINKGIIRAIAAFFILAIGTPIIYALATTNWSSTTPLSFNLANLHLSDYINSTTLNVVIAINVVLALVFLDSILRRKKNRHSTT